MDGVEPQVCMVVADEEAEANLKPSQTKTMPELNLPNKLFTMETKTTPKTPPST